MKGGTEGGRVHCHLRGGGKGLTFPGVKAASSDMELGAIFFVVRKKYWRELTCGPPTIDGSANQENSTSFGTQTIISQTSSITVKAKSVNKLRVDYEFGHARTVHLEHKLYRAKIKAC